MSQPDDGVLRVKYAFLALEKREKEGKSLSQNKLHILNALCHAIVLFLEEASSLLKCARLH